MGRLAKQVNIMLAHIGSPIFYCIVISDDYFFIAHTSTSANPRFFLQRIQIVVQFSFRDRYLSHHRRHHRPRHSALVHRRSCQSDRAARRLRVHLPRRVRVLRRRRGRHSLTTHLVRDRRVRGAQCRRCEHRMLPYWTHIHHHVSERSRAPHAKQWLLLRLVLPAAL